MVERIGNEEGVEFGANVEAAEPILVAQANIGTEAQPAPAPNAAETRVVVELEDGVILRLPATASVDQPRTNGTDLEFVQADGSVIVVPNGAIQGLTIFIGAAEIPPLTVAALFEANGIEAAAGPAGAGARGSGGNFEVPVGGIGDAFDLGDLLDPTALAFGAPLLEDLYPDNTKPSFLLGSYSFRLSEEGLAAGLADSGPAGGADTTNDSYYVINLGATDPDGDPLTFTLSAPTEGLTSNGALIVWEGVGTNHLIGKVGDATVIDITIGGKSGLLIVQLLEPIDHPTGNIEDVLDLGLTVTANDGRGGTATATITIGIEDDSPEAGASTPGNVDEDGFENGVGDSGSPGDNSGNAITATGALGIKWGADNGDLADSLNEDGSFGQDGSGRSVYFSEANFLAFVENYGDLTSGGLPLVFSWTGNTITASVVGEGEGSSQLIFKISLSDDASGSYKFQLFGPLDHAPNGGEPSGEGEGDSDDLPPSEGEFQAKVESDGDGESFEDDIVLNVDFTAKDGDGDTVGGSFTVTVDDDMPVLAYTGERDNTRIVDEDDIRTALSLGTSPNDGAGDGSYTDNPANNGPGPAYIYGSLGGLVNFGADGPGGFAVNSGAIAKFEAYGLESHGDALAYSVTSDGAWATFTATAGKDDRTVFEFRVNVTTGDYEFRLYDQLDHDRPGDDWYDNPSNADQNFDLQDGLEFGDIFALDFGAIVRAYDGDGDYVDLVDQLLIKVRDDVPELVRGKSEIRTVDEDDIRTIGDGVLGGSTGTSPNDGNGDGSYTGSPYNNGLGAATITGSLAHLVQSGADESLSFDFISENTVRSQLSALGLKSNGQTLSYDLQGNVLFGFVNANGIGQSYDVGEDRPVFKLTLNENGSYTFELIDQLDHDLGNGQNYDLQDSLWNQDVGSINFGKLIEATDNDGDSVSLNGAFQIKVRDDVPELVGNGLAFGVVEEEQLPGGNEDTGALLDLDYDLGFLGNNYNVISTVASDNDLMSLKNLIVDGADENGKFSARANVTSSAVRDVDGNIVKSDGVNVVIKSVTSGTDAGGAFTLLTAAAGNAPVFTLKVYADGDWRFQLLDQLDHKADNLEDVLALDLASFLKYTDFDGDSVNLDGDSFLIKVIDDTPEASLKLKSGAKLILDETKADSPQDTSADPNADDEEGVYNPFGNNYGQIIGFAAGGSGTLFTANPSVGADQSGSTVYSLSIASNNDSGVDDTETGQNILLYKAGNDIVGRVGGSNGPVAFVIRADANTGAVKVYQFRAVEHDNDGGTQAHHDESSSPEYLTSGKIYLTQTVTDEDGDKDTATVDLGKVIGFEDDGPKVTQLSVTGRIVSHDETPGINSDADDIYGSLSVFNSVANKGNDLDVPGSGAIGFAKEDDLISFATNFGTDGKAASNDTVFSLVLKGGDGQDSGLKTSEGLAIKLYVEGGIIVGRVGDASGVAAFAIAIDSNDGDISLVQYLSIQHPTGGSSHDESVGLDLVGSNAIEVALTITDRDGDTDVKSVDISDAIRFQDDGPSIEVERADDHHHHDAELNTALLDETTPGGNPNDNTGNADWSLTTNLATAVAIGQVSSTASGNGSVASLFAIDAEGGADGIQSVVKAFSFDLRDDKGNLVSNTTTGVETTLKVTQVANTALGSLNDDDRTIWLYRIDDKTIVGKIHGQNGQEYIALKIELSGTAENPQFTVTQYLPVDHPNGYDHDDALSLKFDDKDASLSIKLTATVTDKDGDTDTDSESVKIITDKSSIVTIEDDGPTITGVTYAALGQELVQNGDFEDGHGLTGSTWELFSAITGWKAGDAVPFEVQTGGAGGVPQTDGTVVELDGDTQSNGGGNGSPIGSTNASIQQTINGTLAGQTYELSFDYAPRTNGGVNTAGLEVYFGGVKVFPADGQTFTANQWAKITLSVTAPMDNAVLEFRGTGAEDEYGALLDNVSLKTQYLGLDDESQPGGIPGGPGDDASGKVLSGKINFDAGTDHLKAIVVDDNINVDAIWVDANGVGHREDVTVEWVQDGQGGRLVGTMERGGVTRPVFELLVNADGTFTLTMQAPLAHPATDADGKNNGPQTEWEDNLSLSFDYKVIDNDGDTATGSINVSVDDDTPDFVGGIDDASVQTLGTTITGDLNIDFGADGQYTDKGMVISGYQNLPGVNEQLSSDGRTLTGWVGNAKVYELKLNANGTYDFTQFANVPGTPQTLSTVSFDADFNAVSSKDYGEFIVKAVGNGSNINGSNDGNGGIGVGNSSGMDDGEKLEIVFDSQMSSVTLGLNHSGGEEMEIDWVAYDQNGNVVASGTTADFDSDTTRTINPGIGFYKLILTADDDSNYSPHPSVRISSLSGVKSATGNIESLDFTVTAKDGDKDAQSDSFTVELKSNTPPVITGTSAGTVVEAGNADNGTAVDGTTSTGPGAATAGTPSVTGTLSAIDPDAGATASWSISSGAGTYGTFAINASTGVWTYTLANGDTDTNGLAEGASVSETFTVTVNDGKGGTDTQDVVITITGANDSPIVSHAVGQAAGAVVEDATTTIGGQLSSSDPDAGATSTWSVSPLSPQSAVTAYGTFSVSSTGQWNYVLNNASAEVQALTASDTITQTFTVRVMDDMGAWDDQEVVITITGANDNVPLTLNALVLGTVEEEHGLLGGIEDQVATQNLDQDDADSGVGANETTNVVTGSFAGAVTGGNEGTLTYAIVAVPSNTQVMDTSGNPVTAGGYQVYFAVNGAGELVGYTNAGGGSGSYGSGDTTVFTLALNEATGGYTFTLQAPIDHHTTGDGVEGNLSISLNGRVSVSDSAGPGADTALINASITVIDDVPVAKSESFATIEGGMQTINLVIMLDRSGSMNDDPDGSGGYQTRLALAKAALINLIETGNTANVLIVPFASNATSSGWLSAQAAIDYIEDVEIPASGQNTDYDAAVNQVYSDYGTPPAADKTYAFFVSDGQPNDGDNTDGIVNTSPGDMEIQAWEKFIVDKGIDQAFAVGVGGGVNAANLAPLAYPNGDATNPVVITQESQLFAVLTAALPGTVSDNILANGDAFGADGEGYILSFKIGAVTYTYNAVTDRISNDADATFINGSTLAKGTPEGGQIVFHFADAGSFNAGDFSYVSPANVASVTEQEQFAYTIVDRDGDGHTATLTVEIDPNTLPDAQNDTFSATGPLTISFAQLLANDTDADGHTVLLYSVQNAVNGTVEIVGTNVIFTPNGGGTGSFTYTVVDGYGGTDTATTTIEIINEKPVLKLNDIVVETGAATENFSSGYNGGTGWKSNWTEVGDGSTGAGSGDFMISAGVLRIADADDDTDDDYIERAVDLTGATSATLTFDHRQLNLTGLDEVRVVVVNGANSQTLFTINSSSSTSSFQTYSVAIPAGLIGAGTKIRLVSDNEMDDNDSVFIDNVQISYVKQVIANSVSNEAEFVEGAATVSIAAAGPTITDADHSTMASAKIVLTNAKAGDVLAVGSLPSGISYAVNTSIAGQITVILTGLASLANYQTAIKAVTFNNTSNDPDETPRVIEVTVTDPLGGTSDPATSTISVTGTNDAPTLASGLTVISNTANAFTVSDDAFLRYATDPDGDTLTVSGASVVSSSLTTASHAGTSVTIDDNVNPGGTLNLVVSDGSLSGNANVSFIQDTNGTIDGTAGNDIIVAIASTPTSQISTVTFAPTYNVGDKVSITINGAVFTHTVTVATQSAEKVYDALKTAQANGTGATLNSYLSTNGYSALSGDLSGTVMTLTGPAALAFAVSAAADNGLDTGMTTYKVDFTAGAFDFDDVLRVTINGVSYSSDGLNSGNNSNARFDDARLSLISALQNAGYTVTNDNGGQDSFDVAVPTTFELPTAVQVLNNGITAAGTTVTQQGSPASPIDQANPAVATTQTASDGGKTLNGLAGHDYLIGSSANDILTGGEGDDILFGGLGNDTLTGGNGEDTFRFAATGTANADTITDFVVGEDTIDLSDLLNGGDIDTNNIGNFVRVQDVGTNGLLQVNTDGSGNDWVDVATLNGHGNPGTVIDLKIDNEDHQIPII